ncbi:MAG: hypothetical protein ACI8RZ_008070 [Myxococcota bacterium]|jgi:hypothetical protein
MKKILTVLAFAMMVGVVQARPGEQPSGERPAPPHEVLIDNADALGLDDATVAEIQAIADASRDRMEALHESARGDESAREAMHEAGREVMESILSLLTEEQREAARELLPPPPGGQGGEQRGPPRR